MLVVAVLQLRGLAHGAWLAECVRQVGWSDGMCTGMWWWAFGVGWVGGVGDCLEVCLLCMCCNAAVRHC